MRKTVVKRLRRVALKTWNDETDQRKVPFGQFFKRIKKAYRRGAIRV